MAFEGGSPISPGGIIATAAFNVGRGPSLTKQVPIPPERLAYDQARGAAIDAALSQATLTGELRPFPPSFGEVLRERSFFDFNAAAEAARAIVSRDVDPALPPPRGFFDVPKILRPFVSSVASPAPGRSPTRRRRRRREKRPEPPPRRQPRRPTPKPPEPDRRPRPRPVREVPPIVRVLGRVGGLIGGIFFPSEIRPDPPFGEMGPPTGGLPPPTSSPSSTPETRPEPELGAEPIPEITVTGVQRPSPPVPAPRQAPPVPLPAPRRAPRPAPRPSSSSPPRPAPRPSSPPAPRLDFLPPLPLPVPRSSPRPAPRFGPVPLPGPRQEPLTRPKTDEQRCRERCERQSRKKRKKKTREVCFAGSYIETKRGLKKRRRKEVPCE